jgi:uncharacterized protein (TIGR02099 family)
MQSSDRSSATAKLLRVLEALAWTAYFAVAAVLLALRFWILPQVEHRQGEVVAALTRIIGLPVTIGALRAEWDGLRPRLIVSSLRVYDSAGREALVLPTVEPVVSWATLPAMQLRLHSLVIDGPRMVVRRDAGGVIHVAGLRVGEQGVPAGGEATAGEATAGAELGLATWVLGQREIEIRNAEVEWRDEQRAAPPLVLRNLQFRLRNRGDLHQIGLSARPPRELGASLELRAALQAREAADPAAWTGRLYAELGNTDLAAWKPWIDYPMEVSSGQGALRVWASVGAGKVLDAKADLALGNVVARLGKDLPVLAISSVRGRVEGRQIAHGYEFGVRRLALVPAQGEPLQGTSFSASWEEAKGAEAARGTLRADLLELGPLARLADYLPFPRDLRALLAELAPQGKLREVDFRWSGELPEPVRYQAQARFEGMTMSAWRAIPGIANLSGRVQANETRGSVQLASRNAELDLPRLFPVSRLQLTALDGEVAWERFEGSRFTVRLANLGYVNEDLAGTASGSYTYDGDGPGVIDLTARLTQANGRNLHRYLPLSTIMGERTRNWLVGAIQGGQSNDARLRLQGNLRDFPFAKPGQGEFHIAVQVRNAVLAFAEGWPSIEDIDGELVFDRNRMEITGRRGRTLGASLSNVRVEIPALGAPDGRLNIQGNAEGPTARFVEYVRRSPLRGLSGGFADDVDAKGDGRLRLKLAIPLAKPDAIQVQGEYRFAGNTLLLDPRLPPVERATGAVSFTEKSVLVSEASGRLFGGPLAVSGGSGRGGDLTVIARGAFTVQGIEPLLDPPWRGLLKGTAPYTATILSRGKRPTRLIIESTLAGVASDLPPPLDKAQAAALPLRVSLVASEGNQRVFVTLGRVLRAELLRSGGDDKSLERAAIAFNPPQGGRLRMPQERRTVLAYGTLERLDLDRWKPLLGGSADGATGLKLATDLTVGALDAFGRRLENINVKASAERDGWSAELTSNPILGNVSYRSADGGKLVARMSRFVDPPVSSAAAPASDLRTLPALDLIADSFRFDGKEFGSMQVVAHPEGRDWVLERLAMRNLDGSLVGKGLWRTGAGASTSLDVEVDASDVGHLLERFGNPGMVRGGSAQGQLSVRWNGDPTDIDFPSLGGTVTLHARDGQFLEIEPGIGKLLSLLSLQMLPRRISLDFSDVFSKGFKWTHIDATAQIANGVIETHDFHMQGSAADVVMTGKADLARETQDVNLRIRPALGSTAATVVGVFNPIAGIATYIGQRALKDPLGQIFSYEYSVTGTWASPKVVKLKPVSVPADRVPKSPD